MTDTEELPRWSPRPDLNPDDLANALEHIRRSAYLHWFGDAFDPEHMHGIAAVAAQALCGQPIDPPVDMTSPEWKAMVATGHEALLALCDDAVVAQARYEDDADETRDDSEEEDCRANGDPFWSEQ